MRLQLRVRLRHMRRLLAQTAVPQLHPLRVRLAGGLPEAPVRTAAADAGVLLRLTARRRCSCNPRCQCHYPDDCKRAECASSPECICRPPEDCGVKAACIGDPRCQNPEKLPLPVIKQQHITVDFPAAKTVQAPPRPEETPMPKADKQLLLARMKANEELEKIRQLKALLASMPVDQKRPPEPVDCKVSDYADWSPCSKTCGGGNRTRTRTIITGAAYGGHECPPLEETEPCNADPCVAPRAPRRCCRCCCADRHSVGARKTASSPSTLPGARARTRAAKATSSAAAASWSSPLTAAARAPSWSRWCVPAHGSARRCAVFASPPRFHAQVKCKVVDCPIPCEVSEWSNFSACTAQCGGGTMYRSASSRLPRLPTKRCTLTL